MTDRGPGGVLLLPAFGISTMSKRVTGRMCEPGGVASSLSTREKFDIASELLNELIDGSRDGYDAVAAQYGVERSHALRG